jgi:hypothetical protein
MRKILNELRGFKRELMRTLSNADVEEVWRGLREASELGRTVQINGSRGVLKFQDIFFRGA